MTANTIAIPLFVKTAVYRLLFWQGMVLIGSVLLSILFKGMHTGFSVLSGELSYFIPQVIFMWQVIKKIQARVISSFVVIFFGGEFVKLFLSAALFVFAMSYFSVSPVATLFGYLIAILTCWTVSVFFFMQQAGKI